MVSLEWYRTFVAIYQCGNLTNAAKELSISQPNVSVHLASLEQYIGSKLFDRMPRKMIPTNHGKKLYTQIVESVENLTFVEQNFKRNTLAKNYTLSLGSPLEFFYTQLARKSKISPFEYNLQFGNSDELIQKIITEKIDFAIVSKKIIENKNLVYEPILNEKFVLVANKDHNTKDFDEYIKESNFTKAEEWLLKQNWFAYSNDLAFIRRFWLINFKKRPLISPSYIIPNLAVILRAIEGGGGISVVSDYLVNDFLKDDKLKIIWKGKEVSSNDLYLTYDKSKVSVEKVKIIKKWINQST
ncbi:LysR family transcriptional regulator [Empedobacter falsenii]